MRICLFLFALSFQLVAFSQISFHKNVLPIFFAKCTPCHLPNNTAPFPLIKYDDWKEKSETIKHVISKNLMPPWVPDTSFSHFANERFLTIDEKETIINWIKSGMRKGEKVEAKSSVNYHNSHYGKPNFVIEMNPYRLSASNQEKFVMDVIPFEFDKDTFVKAFEFVPGNKTLIHHCNQELSRIDEQKLSVEKLYFSGWTPGFFNLVYPDGIGFEFPKKGLLRLNHHYSASPTDTIIQSKVNVFFAEKPIERTVKFLTIGGIESLPENTFIPADTIISFNVQKIVEQDISVLGIYPHMHIFGKSLLALAVTPTNDTIPLIKIDDWRFNWQEIYTPAKMIHLPAKSIVNATFTYDNTSNNILNPKTTPQVVKFEDEMTSQNEMINIFLTYVPYKKGDESIRLNNSISVKK